MDARDLFTNIPHNCFVDTGVIVKLPRCQLNNPEVKSTITKPQQNTSANCVYIYNQFYFESF